MRLPSAASFCGPGRGRLLLVTARACLGAGVNFSSKAQTIDEWIIQGHDLSSDEAIQRVVAFAEMGGLGLIVDTPWSPIMRKPIGRLDA